MTQDTIPLNITDTDLDDALGQRYLSYALSTITARSLPDVRDGLKPVQRRLLYAMFESGNTPDKVMRKSASAVGYVMMKYHPHGDSAIYESMVRMAQSFSLRYPLVEGQGNFGSIDGDGPAAMRYTEARLSHFGMKLLESIKEDTVDFTPNYNNEYREPKVLPGCFPNLLVNGSTGIAVGMATNIPPHNLAEVCDALLHLIKKPDATTKDIFNYIQGPDFPTGGTIIETPETMIQIYETGRGGIRVRANYVVEQLKHGTYQIVVTELPYQSQKAALIAKIADLLEQKRLPLLDDIMDESTSDVRIVLTPRSKNIEPEMLMASLYRVTELESRFNINFNVLDHGTIPKVMSLKQALQSFLNHQQEVLIRQTNFRITQIDERLHILHALTIVFLNLDEVIRIIRFEDDPKDKLIAAFSLDEIQADAILNTRLRSLRKLEEMQLTQERLDLEAERKTHAHIISDVPTQWECIAQKIKQLKKDFKDHSRQSLLKPEHQALEFDPQDYIEKEPLTISCSKNGWIRALKGHTFTDADLKFKEGDEGAYFFKGDNTDKLLVFTSDGRCYTLGTDKLPSGRSLGEPLSMLIDLNKTQDIVHMMLVSPTKIAGQELLLASSDGRGFRIAVENLMAQTKAGKSVMLLGINKTMAQVREVTGDHVAIIGENRKLLVYALSEVPIMTRGRGVTLQKYRDGQMADIKCFVALEGLSWVNGGRNFVEKDLRPWIGRRGQIGKQPPNGFPRSNRF